MNRKKLTTVILCLSAVLNITAQDTLKSRAYTQERPLIYEGAQDLWPYSFLNDNGQPDGYNIDLMKLMLGRLGIPYVIKLKPRMAAFRDMKAGKSDLMIGLTAGFHEQYGYYSENSVTLFTQSILSPKSSPTKIHNFRDLATHKVYVNDSSLCHHLMVDYGWGNNAIPTSTIGETIKQMSTEEKGELVWNTLSLKWMLRKFQIDNLEITPVDMPHGEYKFMSGDKHLISQLDSVFVLLNSTDKLLPLQNKWFYPERQEEHTPVWVWYAAAGIGALLLVMLIFILAYRHKATRITADNIKRNRRLALILETSGVRIWTYDLRTHQFTWRNEYGQPAYVYSREEFATRYSPDDFERLKDAIKQLAELPPCEDGAEEQTITLDIKAKDAREDGDTEMHDFVIALSVLHRNQHGKPTVIIGTKKDVTEKRRREQKAEEEAMDYWAVFYTPMVAILFFDKNNVLTNINWKGCDLFECDRDELIEEQVTLKDFFEIDITEEEANNFYATMIVDMTRIPSSQRKVKSIKCEGKLIVDYRFMTAYDENHELLGTFAICSDSCYKTLLQEKQKECLQRLQDIKAKEEEYIGTIDEFISGGLSRIVSYSPISHVLTIYKGVNKVQMKLTQTRLMTLIDSRMSNKAMRFVSSMDSLTLTPITGDLRTILRIKGQRILHVDFHLIPQLDRNKNVTEYIGILRDISEEKDVEQQLARLEAKAQEIEDTKTLFVRNMMQEITTPLSKVTDNAALLNANKNDETDMATINTIMENADQLTHIINNILYLSRLEAHMVEITKRPTDLAEIFESYCRNGWEKHMNSDVNYIVDNPYKELVVDIDGEHLGYLISQLTLNAAQHTQKGYIRTRYDYVGRRLTISVEDTGEGIDSEKLEELNRNSGDEDHTSSGLGLTICKELALQMGGSMEISSEQGLGTTIWVLLPCHADVIKRKKTV